MNKWINAPKDISQYFGFVYLITNTLNGRMYIGKKQFYSTKKGKRYKESDWKTYYGSCNELNRDIQISKKSRFTREIISCHETRWETTYNELAEQVKRDVLRDRKYYNGIIRVRLPAFGKKRG